MAEKLLNVENSRSLVNCILELYPCNLEHERLKASLGNLLERIGFSVTFEYKLKNRLRNQYIDLVAINEKTGFRIGIEIDRATPKLKSIEKLRKLRPDLALMVLRSKQIPKGRIRRRVSGFSSCFTVLNLPQKRIIFLRFERSKS